VPRAEPRGILVHAPILVYPLIPFILVQTLPHYLNQQIPYKYFPSTILFTLYINKIQSKILAKVIQPNNWKFSNPWFPSFSIKTIPPRIDAIPPLDCWMAELIFIKAPRSLAPGIAVIIAVALIILEDTNNIIQLNATATINKLPAGTLTNQITQIPANKLPVTNNLYFPQESLNFPKKGDPTKVAIPAAKKT